MLRWVSYLVVLAGLATPVQALELGACTRVTHISHGGEADHVDLGQGRTMWIDWWSQEGSATIVNLIDCEDGLRLRARTQEENMSARPPFNRTQGAMEIIARHETGARVFATLPRIASDLEKVARDVTVFTDKNETCACAALYPELRGDKTEIRLEGL